MITAYCIACSPRRTPGQVYPVSLPGTRQAQEQVCLCKFHQLMLSHYWNAIPISQRSATVLWRFVELEVYRYSLERALTNE